MGIDVKKSVIINKSSEELYRFWRNFENLPRFMNHIESVKSLDNKRSHWVAKAPLGTKVEWDAEIISENEPKTIVWRSLEGADVDNTGSVAFTVRAVDFIMEPITWLPDTSYRRNGKSNLTGYRADT